MRLLRCHCGATAQSPGGFLKDEADATGFYPVFHFGGDIRWFCPQHTKEVFVAVEALRAACGGDIDGLVPPMLRRRLGEKE